MAILVDIHGSCVSRNAFNLIDDSKIKVNHLFSRNNIASCMMPPSSLTFQKEELVQYKSEYSERCMTYALNKKTLDILLKSESEYLVLDFFDFCQPVAGYKDTTFSTYDYTFYNTSAYKENKEDFVLVDFLKLPHSLWYGYVDMYFKRVTEKFGKKIILNRLNCSSIYLTSEKTIQAIPERLLAFGNAGYNKELAFLEEYIIKKYPDIYITDVSKYFIPDYSYNPDTTPVHYEENYNILLSSILEDIVNTGTETKYHDTIPARMVAKILNRPVSDDDFIKIYSDRTLPFCSNTLLDYIFKQCRVEEIAINRRWIADLYQEYSMNQTEITADIDIFIEILSKDCLWTEKSNFKNLVYTYLCNVKKWLELSVDQLYQDFLCNFDNELVEKWTIQLYILSIIAPGYERVSQYLFAYYNAIADDNAIIKLLR